MKILLISNLYPSRTFPNYGTFVKNFCDQLDQLNISYKKVVLKKKKSRYMNFLAYIIYFIKVFFYSLFENYDFVYVHYISHNALILRIIYFFKRITIFVNVHGSDVIPQTKVQFKMQKNIKKILIISKRVIVPSEYFRKIVCQKYKIKNEKIKVYPSGGVNEKIFYPYSRSEKDNLIEKYIKNNSKEFFYIGYVSRIDPGKGWKTFLEALNLLNNRELLDDKEIVMVGDGNEYDSLVSKIHEYHLNSKILLIKSLEQKELAKIYNVLDIFCFPTEREGESLGLVALEAMSCGVPVIASNYAAPNEYISDYYNGFKFKKGNVKDLAEKIDIYFKLTDKDKNRIRDNALKTAEEFHASKMINMLENILVSD